MNQSGCSIKVTWSLLTNQDAVLPGDGSTVLIHNHGSPGGTHHHPEVVIACKYRISVCPISTQYSGHVICIDQSQASTQVMWPVLTNHRPVFRSRDQYWPVLMSRDQYWPMTGHHSGHLISIDQSQASIHTWGSPWCRPGPRWPGSRTDTRRWSYLPAQ